MRPGARVHSPREIGRVPLVYLIRNPHSGLVKIGKTNDLQQRIKNLEIGSGCELELLSYVSDLPDSPYMLGRRAPKDVERYLHRRLAEFRQFGEWFSPTRQVLGAFGVAAG